MVPAPSLLSEILSPNSRPFSGTECVMFLAIALLVHLTQPASLHCYQAPPGQAGEYSLTVQYQQLHLKMTGNLQPEPSQEQSLDPTAPLGTKDLAMILINNCTNRILEERAYTKELMEEERRHTKDLIDISAKTVIAGLVKGMEDGFAAMADTIDKQAQTIVDLELKLETYSKYHEQLTYQQWYDKIHDQQNKKTNKCSICIMNPTIAKDITTNLSTAHFHCNSCHTIFESVRDLYLHECNTHTNSLPNRCWTCGLTFTEGSQLKAHLDSVHVQEVNNHCRVCNQVFGSIVKLREHSESCHAERNESLSTCNVSGTSFKDLSSPAVQNTDNHGPSSVIPNSSDHISEPNECELCDKVFSTINEKEDHMQSHIGALPFRCRFCDFLSQSKDKMALHIECKHGTPTPRLHCNLCDHISSNMLLLNVHIRETHLNNAVIPVVCPTPSSNRRVASLVIPCNLCGRAFLQKRELDEHMLEVHGEVQEGLDGYRRSYCSSYENRPGSVPDMNSSKNSSFSTNLIPQYDGNDSISSADTDITTTDIVPPVPLVNPITISASSSTPVPTQQPGNSIQFQYSLNPLHQVRRLHENSTREAFTIRYSNPQYIHGRKHNTSVSIDCNSGVYLSAVKPALQQIFIGWETKVLSSIISCVDKSDRTEMSGRTVCTKLVLHLSEQALSPTPCKVVLHFYHTSSTLLVQGSSVLSCGMSSPVWLVEHFLEPLARNHAAQNKDTIDSINHDIRQSSTVMCGGCRAPIKPSATLAKDQDLSCCKCGTMYHKKCTDRRKTPGNWKKTPWFCQSCVLGTNQNNSTDNDSQPQLQQSQPCPGPPQGAAASKHLPYVPTTQACPTVSMPIHDTLLQIPPAGIRPPPVTLPSLQHSAAPQTSPSTLPSAVPMQGSPIQPTTSTNTASQASHSLTNTQGSGVRFPQGGVRQRSSNITVKDPEFEFQKTALDSCRSTIVQQETELKKLREALDIRNKKIIQLEGQVNHASEYIGGRHITDSSLNKSLHDSIALLLEKMDSHLTRMSSAVNNINIGNLTSRTVSETFSKASQTDIQCCNCDLPTSRSAADKNHTQELHETLQCDYCDFTNDSDGDMTNHIESVHALDPTPMETTIQSSAPSSPPEQSSL